MGKIPCVYWGIFFDDKQFENFERPVDFQSLAKDIPNKHVTFGYGQDSGYCPEALIGEEAKTIVVGYGNDGKNEALLVVLEPQIKRSEYSGAENVHVTLSTSKDGKPVDSANLVFRLLDKPFAIRGVYGYFDGKEVVTKVKAATFEYCFAAESREHAGRVAQGFHEKLCGNPDYRDDRIILNWSGDTVILTMFSDATTSLQVHAEAGKDPELFVEDSWG